MDENANDFQYKVADYFKAKGWSVEISPYYADMLQQKPREIDIIAQKKWMVADHFNRKRAHLLLRLFVECKWILPSVSIYLNFLPKDMNLALDLARDNDVIRKRDYPLLKDTAKDPHRIHHYIQGDEVAKTAACTGSNRDIFFQAWDQVLHALLYTQHHEPKFHFRPIDADIDTAAAHIISYPVVVVSSFNRFFKRDPIVQKSSPIYENFIFSVNYSYPVFSGNEQRRHLRRDFFIDITSFPLLENFLENLERNDVEILRERIWQDLSR